MFNSLLILHIVGGATALLTGMIAALTRKGSFYHKRVGKVFVYSMVLSSLAALALTWIHPNAFLQGIALFTLYFCLSGKWGLKKKRGIFKIMGTIGFTIGIYLLVVGLTTSGKVNLISLGFAGTQLLFAFRDFATKPESVRRVIYHGSRMGGAYISAVTAFFVVALPVVPWYLGWFGPSVVGTVLLFRSLGRFSKKQPSL